MIRAGLFDGRASKILEDPTQFVFLWMPASPNSYQWYLVQPTSTYYVCITRSGDNLLSFNYLAIILKEYILSQLHVHDTYTH